MFPLRKGSLPGATFFLQSPKKAVWYFQKGDEDTLLILEHQEQPCTAQSPVQPFFVFLAWRCYNDTRKFMHEGYNPLCSVCRFAFLFGFSPRGTISAVESIPKNVSLPKVSRLEPKQSVEMQH